MTGATDKSDRATHEPSQGLGHSVGVPSADMWPEIEFDGAYPDDEEFAAFDRLPLDFSQAAFWLLNELPRAAENMLCFCEVDRNAVDSVGRDCIRIRFSTGGWSGAESIIALIERRLDLSHFMESWRRGGHYVFELPVNPQTPVNTEQPK